MLRPPKAPHELLDKRLSNRSGTARLSSFFVAKSLLGTNYVCSMPVSKTTLPALKRRSQRSPAIQTLQKWCDFHAPSGRLPQLSLYPEAPPSRRVLDRGAGGWSRRRCPIPEQIRRLP